MTDYSHYTYATVEIDTDGVALCTFNRPDSLNAIRMVDHHELEDMFADFRQDKAIKAIVLTGAGRAFTAGGDVKGMGDRNREDEPAGLFDSGARQLAMNLLSIDQPVIAAVNGPAIGLGATIALLCDVVYMADDARIGDPHVKVGLVPGDGAATIWPLLIGPARAKEYLMSGDLLDAAEADRIGLVNRVFPADRLLDESMAFARRLARGPTLAIRFAKLSVQRMVLQQALNTLDVGLALEAITGFSEDHKEAAKAFQEKRDPEFKGR